MLETTPLDRTRIDDATYYRTMDELFAHPGWQLLVADAQRQIYQLQADALDPGVCPTWDLLNIARGRAIQLHELILLPEINNNLKNAAAEDRADADV